MNHDTCLKLKERRKELGYTIEEVVEKTKLYPSVIRDLEEGNISKIDVAYLRGFVRIYASFLGLDAAELLKDITVDSDKAQVQRQSKSSAATQGLRLPSFKFTMPRIPPIPVRLRQAILAGVIGLVALFIVVKVTGFVFKKISQGLAGAKRGKAVRAKTIKPQERDVFQEALPPASKKVKEAPPKEAPVRQVSVSITAKRNCFLRVKADGKILLEGVLEKGKLETWKAEKEIELSRISDGSALYIEINGKPVPALVSSRKPVKSVTITSAGISVVK
ncbi:MAG: RodZ domain-containing protein [Candidatus Omnitrophota bacterium]|nr:DUF4115 domain-containing protein [Candidatus Omnitrophota bacterium]